MKISNEIVKQQFVQREYGLAHSTYDNELDFYQLVSSGDVKALSGMLLTGDEDEAVLASRGILSDDKVRNRRYHEIVLVVVRSKKNNSFFIQFFCLCLLLQIYILILTIETRTDNK